MKLPLNSSALRAVTTPTVALRRLRKALFASALLVLSVAGPRLDAAAPSWTFSPPTAGRALQTGGWTVDCVKPPAALTPGDEFTARKQPANYWLVEDRARTYAYGLMTESTEQWNPADITVTHRSGLVEKMTYMENMKTKLLNGQLTAMTYNAANQLVKALDLGPATVQTVASLPKTPEALEKLAKSSQSYTYDRAGRMLGTGPQPQNTYGWLDKLTHLTLPDGTTSTHTYWPDGHLASISPSSNQNSKINNPQSSISSSSESFLWDGLALLKRNDTLYIIESHPSGGIPIASHPVGKPEEITYHLNDLLGTTLATVGPAGVNFSRLTSFGQPLKSSASGSSLGTDAPSSPTNPVPTTNQLPPTKR